RRAAGARGAARRSAQLVDARQEPVGAAVCAVAVGAHRLVEADSADRPFRPADPELCSGPVATGADAAAAGAGAALYGVAWVDLNHHRARSWRGAVVRSCRGRPRSAPRRLDAWSEWRRCR